MEPSADTLRIKAIVESVDIATLASRYTRLWLRDDNSYVGRCPVHNGSDHTFMVDAVKGVCGCSQCGRAWGKIDLVMELEHTDFAGAVRLLAQDAGDAPGDTPAAPDSRDAMYAANAKAAAYFARTLTSEGEGRAVGLAYFRQRGINDAMVERFGLGFSPTASHAAHDELTAAGVSADTLVACGLSASNERGYYDRYRGRVIYPVHTVSGRVVAFGARTLRTDKDVAKYVNSPESAVYSKSRELYGLYQARDAIVEKGFAILVEGYMDVISMHQNGVCNVVASSGTSLTQGQVALLRRFTDRVVVIYDADAAGIKAAVRSIDMLLSAGVDMQAVRLPAGDDPDSFARSHTPAETERYLAEHAINMVDFRLSLLPEAVLRDPVERTRAISQIIDSIALVADDNRRRYLIGACRNRRELRLTEKAIVQQVSRRILENAQRADELRRRQQAADAMNAMEADMLDMADPDAPRRTYLRPYERNVVSLMVKYGIMQLPDATTYNPDGTLVPMNAVQLIHSELEADEMEISNPDLRAAYDHALKMSLDTEAVDTVSTAYRAAAESTRQALWQEGVDKLETEHTDISKLEVLERALADEVNAKVEARYAELCANYVASEMLVNPDATLRRIAAGAIFTTRKVSTIYTRNGLTGKDDTGLVDKIMLQIYCLKYATVLWQIREIREAIRSAGDDFEAIQAYMTESKRLGEVKKLLASNVGDRVIAPPF